MKKIPDIEISLEGASVLSDAVEALAKDAAKAHMNPAKKAAPRFGLFLFERYEQCGGWSDFVGAFSSRHAARKGIKPFLVKQKPARPALIDYGYQVADFWKAKVVSSGYVSLDTDEKLVFSGPAR